MISASEAIRLTQIYYNNSELYRKLLSDINILIKEKATIGKREVVIDFDFRTGGIRNEFKSLFENCQEVRNMIEHVFTGFGYRIEFYPINTNQIQITIKW